MGCFSWMYADLNNERPLLIGAPAFVMCPSGNIIFEPAYNGYGMFGGHDIYEMVVDWNRANILCLVESNTHRPLYHWSKEFLQLLQDSEEKAEEYIQKNFPEDSWIRKEWKRNLGIDIACYDDQNIRLEYPIKITRRKEIPYSALPASLSDVGQGFGYSDE